MIKTYFNEKAEVWDELFAEKNRLKLESIVERMDITAGSAVLDIGTGTGVLLPFLVENGAGTIHALDLAEKMLRKSMDKVSAARVFYVQGDIMRTPFISCAFDTVICYSSFPHFRDKMTALGEIYRILRKGGRLYIAHTSGRTTINRIHSGIPGIKDDLLPDSAEMLDLLNRNGFSYAQVDDNQDSYFVKATKIVA